MTKSLLAFVLLAGGISSTTLAGTIRVSEIGGGINLNSGPLTPGVFGNGQTTWTTASLLSAHQSLLASGINTNMKITIVAADTTHGLSLMALIDQQQATQGTAEIGNVGMVSVGHGANLAFLNAAGGDVTVTPNSSTSRTASGHFDWNFHGDGNAFAWANLEVGNTMTWRFNQLSNTTLGLVDPNTFQFVTWTGQGWAVVPISSAQLSFTDTDDFGFTATVVNVIPLPSGSALAGASLLGMTALRRRRAR